MPTSPATAVTRRADHLVEAGLAEVAAEPVEGVVLQDLAAAPLVDGGARARADEQDELAVGHRRSRRSSRAVPRKPVVPVMEMPLAGECSTITPHVYHLVERLSTMVRWSLREG